MVHHIVGGERNAGRCDDFRQPAPPMVFLGWATLYGSADGVNGVSPARLPGRARRGRNPNQLGDQQRRLPITTTPTGTYGTGLADSGTLPAKGTMASGMNMWWRGRLRCLAAWPRREVGARHRTCDVGSLLLSPRDAGSHRCTSTAAPVANTPACLSRVACGRVLTGDAVRRLSRPDLRSGAIIPTPSAPPSQPAPPLIDPATPPPTPPEPPPSVRSFRRALPDDETKRLFPRAVLSHRREGLGQRLQLLVALRVGA